MLKFPEFLLELTIIIALVSSAFVAISLVYLLLKDKRKNEVW